MVILANVVDLSHFESLSLSSSQGCLPRSQSSPSRCFHIAADQPFALMDSEFREKLNEKWENFDFSNAIALLLLMKEIQEQEPLDDPGIIMIAKDGTPLY